MQVLIYAPPPRSARPMAQMFRQHGLRVEQCVQAEHCLNASMSRSFEVVIYLHSGSSTQLKEFFTKWKSCGCSSYFIVVSDVQSGLERAQALELGIDNYYIEPCSYSRLLIEMMTQAMVAQLQQQRSIQTAHFVVDVIARTIHYQGVLLLLSKTEFTLLSYLIRQRGHVLSRVQLWEEVWGDREYPLGNTVDVHIGRLRRKLNGAELIQSVHGIGYRLKQEA